MKAYRLEILEDRLPEDLWGGNAHELFLPDLPTVRPTGEVLAWACDTRGHRIPLAWLGGLALEDSAAVHAIRDAGALRSPRPWMSYAPCHPHRLPPRLRGAIRNLLALGNRLRPEQQSAYPRWPIEPTLEVWRWLAQTAGVRSERPPWPDGRSHAVCLSHDVDTAEGQRRVRALATIEEDLGLRSAWFLCPGNYAIDRGLWDAMAERGHEIGCHGLRHDFKLPYLSRSAIESRLDQALEALTPYNIFGFRSPALLRTPALLEAVARRFAYDSTIPDTVRLHGPSGSGSVHPYRLGSQVELPVTMPYDGELIALRIPEEKRLELWQTKAAWIQRRQGVVHMLTHPDPQFSGDRAARHLYQRVLEHLLATGETAWFALPHEVARHAGRDWESTATEFPIVGALGTPCPIRVMS